MQPTRPCGGFGVGLAHPAIIKLNPSPSASLVPSPGTRLYSLCLEKRSQALQACNLTRNIQADGAPMVHRTPGTSQGSAFSTIGHRSYALKTHRVARPGVSTTVPSPCGGGRLLFAQRAIVSPRHLSGTLTRRSMKRGERSKGGAGSFNKQGLRSAGPAFVLELRSARYEQPSSPRHRDRCQSGRGHAHPFRAVRAAVFP